MWWIAWLSLAIILLIVELLTVELVSIWFSASSLVLVVITAIFPELHWGWQIFIFTILSAGLLLLTRPFVKKILKRRRNQETNLELILNHTALVEEEINNDLAMGAVKINGLIWSARSEDGSLIEKGKFVIVQKIDGNKLIVIKRKEKEE